MSPSGLEAPGPGGARTIDELVQALGRLRVWAGSPSYSDLARAVGAVRDARGSAVGTPGRVTVYDCFRAGRTRLDQELVLDVVAALGRDQAAVHEWRAALLEIAAPVVLGGTVEICRPPESHPGFAGREDLLADLVGTPPGVTVALTGLPGVGKTELALQLVRAWVQAPDSAADSASERVWYADLRGHEDTSPSSRAVVDALLEAGGVPATELRGLDQDDRAARARRLLDEQRRVVLLDNVRDTEQVESLLARSSRARLVLTSRRELVGLRGTRARQATVAELTPDAALALLARHVGAERIAAEPEVARSLVAACGHLPLDLNVLAGAIGQRRGWTLADHASRLAALPLDELRRPALTASYRQLDEDTRRMYRLLALHPGAFVRPDSAAALAACAESAATSALRSLEVEHLVRADGDGASRLHDVTRAHARWLLDDEEPHREQSSALRRLAAHYVDRARQGDGGLAAGASAADRSAALAWFDDQRSTVLALADASGAWDMGEEVGDLSAHLSGYLDLTGRFADAEHLHRIAVQDGPVGQQPAALRRLGRACEQLGRLEEALTHLQLALARNRELGIQDAGFAANGVGNALKALGRMEEAAEAYADALAAAREAGDRLREGRARGNLGNALRLMGRYPEAGVAMEEALAISREVDDAVHVPMVLANLGLLASSGGDLDRAVLLLEQSLDTAEQAGARGTTAGTVYFLALTKGRLGQHAEALELLDEAGLLAEQIGQSTVATEVQVARGRILLELDRHEDAAGELRSALARAVLLRYPQAEVDAATSLAEVLLATGGPEEAEVLLGRALELASRTQDRSEVARAHRGLGDLAMLRGRPDEARECWREALAVYGELRDPRAEEVRALLDGLAQDL